MKCPKCGSESTEGSKFCEECGAPLDASASSLPAVPEKKEESPEKAEKPEEKPEKKEKADKKFRRMKDEKLAPDEDGKYRWIYEVNLFTNPTYFVLVWKIFFFIFLGIFAVTMIFDAVEWSDFFPDRLLADLKFLGIFVAGMTVITALGYFIYAVIMGGKYIVEFEMDENGINHCQIAAQAKKARMISRATIAAGLAAGRLSTVAAGMNARRTEMYSDFSKVKKLKIHPRRRLIKLNSLFSHNQVYASKENFEFVKEFIVSHCTKVKTVKK